MTLIRLMTFKPVFFEIIESTPPSSGAGLDKFHEVSQAVQRFKAERVFRFTGFVVGDVLDLVNLFSLIQLKKGL